MIDHTALRAELTEAQIIQHCEEARTWNFYSVCVNSRWLPRIRQELEGTKVLPITVVGFPLGASLSEAKIHEAQAALLNGAREIDMVIDLGALFSQHWGEVEADVRGVATLCREEAARLKVILETALLKPEQITHAAKLCVEAGAHCVKTSTGFSPAGGATVEAVRLLRQAVGPEIGVKASGGIKSAESFLKMLDAGADRIGCSTSVQIMESLS